MKALLLIDLQNDFMPGGPLGVRDADTLPERVNSLQRFFPRVIATQDYHPADHVSFATNHPGKAVSDLIEVDGVKQVLWPSHCVQGSTGADLVRTLETQRIEMVVRKGCDRSVDSYSGFFDVARKHATGLSDYLRAEALLELAVAGVATDYCVKFTVLDALAEGFRVSVVADCCRGVDLRPGDSDRAMEEMREAGARIVTTQDIVAGRAEPPAETRYEGKYIRMVARDRWEYAERTNCHSVVVVVAVDGNDLLVTEQFRVPVGRTVLELPAGLAGDVEGAADEDGSEAARRELIEETGFDAREVTFLASGPSSAGLSNETVSFYHARGLKRVSDGGGIGDERIVVHRVPLTRAVAWLREATERGHIVDPKVYAALALVGAVSTGAGQ